MHSPKLVLVAHGSRDPRFAATARRVRSAVAAAMPGIDVELSYLDLNDPAIGTVIARSGDCVVVPLLFAEGFHSKIDLPAIVVDNARPGQRVVQTPVIGSHSLTGALADRLAEAGLREDDGVLLCAVGSSDASADRHARRRSIELSTLLHRPVDVVFATKLGSRDNALRSSVRRLKAAGAERIVLSPYFLSAGLLTERVETALDRLCPDALVAGPLGAHPDVVDTVVELYADAIGGGTRDDEILSGGFRYS
ncbi:sirohydrochlorin chelatase [Gordonia sp. (in: high G+C Gram-positive bacteria)]|uniref:sirohydrochlorin chelatase n=1 Tax=Gordonia sp. (in: high G+C Gram-positive bacteria) TaxID=84139 RepID=UPI001D5CF2B8|nr:sirohydrochlorin chelatase [Gordonia sp. (in: high G+C Gram-positive bacteria)]MCB1295096.1 sirohydrochlorin chelatase [Gordonia sp. (in: high G+C Gram-positive bacteria)]HMS76998.1 sirohydrochlorin chelatase [Gordonia sp. (in: high G+C Gram-positive bacteria)]HQV19790.1 sirohydrochlorin chelatase [Gordonia sp. (in: high G+C Gram-positive bacteria)]